MKYIKNILIFGAGGAGKDLLRSAKKNKINVFFFIDSNIDKRNTYLDKVKIVHESEIKNIVNNYQVDEVWIAIPSISKAEILKIRNRLIEFVDVIKWIPSFDELLADTDLKKEIKMDTSILLNRKEYSVDSHSCKNLVKKKVVLICGAGGSIGSELSKQICKGAPNTIILSDLSEFSLFTVKSEIDELIIQNGFNTKVVSILGDLSNIKNVDEIFKNYSPEIVIHAAAYKHVFMSENNPRQVLFNNIISTYNLCCYSSRNNVKKFIMISSDKAVNPSNIMGLSKLVCEVIVDKFQKNKSLTRFSSVRFGNVLNSSGSVIPIFLKQISKGGPITLRDRKITRYFMTIEEACSLILKSAKIIDNKLRTFVLDMGDPVKIYDLAKSLIKLRGFSNDPSKKNYIEIKITKLLKGEKLHETLCYSGRLKETNVKKIKFISENNKLEILSKTLKMKSFSNLKNKEWFIEILNKTNLKC